MKQTDEHIKQCEKKLRNGLALMNIQLDDNKISQLIKYLIAFDKWNKAYNLSAIRDPLAMVDRHLLDSLVLLPFLQTVIQEKQKNLSPENPLRIIDVGTGGGLPGIPLAIACADNDVELVLLDSNGKKTRFLFQVKTELGLDNMTVENTRVEKYQPETGFDIVVSRAFASLDDMVVGSAHLLVKQATRQGVFWAMKGVYPEKELRDCAKHAIVESSTILNVPGEDGERHLIVLKPLEPLA